MQIDARLSSSLKQALEKESEKPNLTTLIEQRIFQKQDFSPSLHDRMLNLLFYKKLKATTLTSDELLLNFVNVAAVFSKLETLFEVHQCFGNIVGKDLFRAKHREKDIDFFCSQLELKRPKTSSNTDIFLTYIEKQNKKNPDYLLPILFVEYGSLFLGRQVHNAVSANLKKMIVNWDNHPPDNRGLCFWDFKNMTTKEFETAKETFYQAVNAHAFTLESKTPKLTAKLVKIGCKAFILHTNMMETCVNSPTKLEKKITFYQEENPKIARIRLLFLISMIVLFIGLSQKKDLFL